MKLEDYEKVQELIRQRSDILFALDQCKTALDSGKYSSDYFSGGYFSAYRDGNGNTIKLSGCGVYYEVVELICLSLKTKLMEVEAQLYNLGVQV